MKRSLKRVDLIAADCIRPAEAVLAMRHCMKSFDFGRAVLFSSVDWHFDDIEVIQIPPLKSLDDYGNFILKLNQYCSNDYVLIVQEDGYIINPANWTDEYLAYDYIGAPWPAEESWIRGQPAPIVPFMLKNFKFNRVGNGGFSLRSRKFLQFAAQFEDTGPIGEDSFLCVQQYDRAKQFGIRFAPFELAAVFSYENPCIEFGTSWFTRVALDVNQHFGFHGKKFHNAQALLDIKRQ